MIRALFDEVRRYVSHLVGGDAARLCVLNTAAVANSTVAIGGNIQLVKEGSGAFTSEKAQTYTGGSRPIRSSYGEDGARQVTFADGAAVKVLHGSRAIAKGEAIMPWTDATRPSNLASLKFTGVFDGKTVGLSKRSDGLYLAQGLTIVVPE